jgi:hypothetical protein
LRLERLETRDLPAGITTLATALIGGSIFESYEGLAVDTSGNRFVTVNVSPGIGVMSSIEETTPSGTHSQISSLFEFPLYGALATNARGNVFAVKAFSGAPYHSVIVQVTPSGAVSPFAGNGTDGFSGDGGPATNASLSRIGGLAVDANGDVFLADTGNNRIREVTPDGIIRTLAGNGTAGFSGDGGPATNAALNTPPRRLPMPVAMCSSRIATTTVSAW